VTLPAVTEDWKITNTSLRLRDPNMSYESFEGLCAYLGESYATVRKADTALKWAIGDAINQGEALFGHRSYQAFEEFGLSPEVLRDCARVAQRVDPGTRKENISWSHHRAVAHQLPSVQRELLKKVSEEGISHHQLREEIRNGAPAQAQTCRCCGRPLQG
jgi:hypothetical protein